MKIIALQGRANCGKTTVLTKAYYKLCLLCANKFYMKNKVGDFTALFDYNGHVIGVFSGGDSEKDLIVPFEFFEKNSCELCIVACRPTHRKFGSKNFIEKKSKEYGVEIIWYTKAAFRQWNTKYNLTKETDMLDEIQANILVEEIKLQI